MVILIIGVSLFELINLVRTLSPVVEAYHNLRFFTCVFQLTFLSKKAKENIYFKEIFTNTRLFHYNSIVEAVLK